MNNTICLPFEGIVSKRTKNSITVDVGSNILFTIEDVKPNLHLFEKINPDTIIAYASSYIIYANEKYIIIFCIYLSHYILQNFFLFLIYFKTHIKKLNKIIPNLN